MELASGWGGPGHKTNWKIVKRGCITYQDCGVSSLKRVLALSGVTVFDQSCEHIASLYAQTTQRIAKGSVAYTRVSSESIIAHAPRQNNA